ncbi:hypothetical protein LFREDSHE_24860 [Shewanella baltica]
MSSIVGALYELKYNPFEYGAYLASFYTALVESENNLLLAPLVIPLCSHPVLVKQFQGLYLERQNKVQFGLFSMTVPSFITYKSELMGFKS